VARIFKPAAITLSAGKERDASFPHPSTLHSAPLDTLPISTTVQQLGNENLVSLTLLCLKEVLIRTNTFFAVISSFSSSKAFRASFASENPRWNKYLTNDQAKKLVEEWISPIEIHIIYLHNS